MKTSFTEFARIIREATNNEIALFDDKSCYPKPNAQSNLSGRTHYVDDATLSYFSSRILSAREHCGGTLFVIVESSALNYEKTQRGFRPVVFDIFGNTVYRPSFDEAFKTRLQAEKALSKWYGAFDVESYYAGVLSEKSDRLARNAAAMKAGAAALAEIVAN